MQESDGDPRYQLPPGLSIITPERAAKGDVSTGPPCPDCKATGRVKSQLGIRDAPCKACRGKGWTGSVNAATIAASDVRFAQVREDTVLGRLWEHGLIDDQQHHDGQTYRIWRDMHRAQMGLARPVSSGGEAVSGVRLRAYGYIILIRRMDRYDYRSVEASVQPMEMSWAEWIARDRPERYVRALDRLTRLLPPIKDQIAYLEGLEESQRDELSKEGVKIMLAEIRKQ